MIRHRSQVRLTEYDTLLLIRLTGSDPGFIRTQQQLESFVHAHLCLYPGRTPEETLLRGLLEQYIQDELATAPSRSRP